MKKSRTVSSKIPKLSFSLLSSHEPNLFLHEYSIPSIQTTDLNRSLCVCVYGQRYGFGGVCVAISGSDGSRKQRSAGPWVGPGPGRPGMGLWRPIEARNRERGRVRDISGQYNRRTLTTKILASLNQQCTVTELFLPE